MVRSDLMARSGRPTFTDEEGITSEYTDRADLVHRAEHRLLDSMVCPGVCSRRMVSFPYAGILRHVLSGVESEITLSTGSIHGRWHRYSAARLTMARYKIGVKVGFENIADPGPVALCFAQIGRQSRVVDR
jgi:hypothetical protein